MNTANLIQAVSMCACPEGGCSISCVVCHSPTWKDGLCVRRRWAAHAATREGQRAAQRFNNMTAGRPLDYECDDDNHDPGCTCPGVVARPPVDEKSEAAIDFIEDRLGIALVPWQANMIRQILGYKQ